MRAYDMVIPVNEFGSKMDKYNSNYKGSSTNSTNNSMEKREYIANSKRFTIDNNKIHLRIVGNDNKINMKSNSGYLDVVGNSTKVKIGENSGRINYTGNSGKIYLGTDSQTKAFKYSGNNGQVKLVNKDSLWKKDGSGSTSSSQKR